MVAIAETKSEDDVVEKGFALMLTANNGGKVLNISTPVVNST